MITTRNVLLFVHILSAAAWLGADFLQFALAPRFRKDPAADLAWARQVQWLHAKYYAVFAVVLLVTGIWLVLDGPYTASSGFIWFGVGAIVIGASLGGGVLGKLSTKRVEALESGDSAEAASLLKRMAPFEVVITASALLALMLMVGKWQA